jgi:hypothetical protein
MPVRCTGRKNKTKIYQYVAMVIHAYALQPINSLFNICISPCTTYPFTSTLEVNVLFWFSLIIIFNQTVQLKKMEYGLGLSC